MIPWQGSAVIGLNVSLFMHPRLQTKSHPRQHITQFSVAKHHHRSVGRYLSTSSIRIVANFHLETIRFAIISYTHTSISNVTFRCLVFFGLGGKFF